MLLENLLDIYQGKSLLVICFIVSMIYIVCVIKETTLRRNLIVAAFAIIFVFNNIALWIWKDLMGESILYELLYAVPVFSCIAYCVCHIIGRQKSVVMKVIVGAVAVVLICVLSSMPGRIYDDVKEQNDTGMDDIEDIADFLKGSFTEIESRPVILCGQEGYDTLRSFMPYMLTAIGNDVFNDGQPDKDSDEYVALNIANADLTEDMDRVNEALENLEVEYIVFPDKDGVREYAARLGFFNVVDKQIFDLYEKQDYDLIVLDVNLPDGNGFDICHEVKERRPDTAVIFLTANDMESDMLKGFELGADDYVTKPFPISVFQKKVSALLNRISAQSGGDFYDDGNLYINFSELSACLAGQPITLTSLEYRLLKVLTRNSQTVLTRQVLLEKLWDVDENYVDEHALTTTISRIRSKIETNQHSYIKTVYGMGYMWIGGAQK